MRLLGLIPEPPFDPRSWSGSAAPLFRAFQARGMLAAAEEVKLSSSGEALQKALAFSWPMKRWKESYHASVPRFQALGQSVREKVDAHRPDAVLQIGAWFCAGAVSTVPAFSYHDGNAAEWYRHYGKGLLPDSKRRKHMEWERFVYKSTRGIFVMSTWLADSFIKDFGVPSGKVHVVGAGINLERFPVVPQRSFEIPRFLFVGRDFERKGGKHLLEAFRIVRAEMSNAELTIVGPALNLTEPGVTCAGFLSKSNPQDQRTLERLFGEATAMVLPSIYEPFGISLTEGMMYGLPCVTVDRCAMPEIVDGCGMVARPEDAQDLARAMLDLAKDPVRCAEYGRMGRARAEANYTWEAVTGKIEHILAAQYGLS